MNGTASAALVVICAVVLLGVVVSMCVQDRREHRKAKS